MGCRQYQLIQDFLHHPSRCSNSHCPVSDNTTTPSYHLRLGGLFSPLLKPVAVCYASWLAFFWQVSYYTSIVVHTTSIFVGILQRHKIINHWHWPSERGVPHCAARGSLQHLATLCLATFLASSPRCHVDLPIAVTGWWRVKILVKCEFKVKDVLRFWYMLYPFFLPSRDVFMVIAVYL